MLLITDYDISDVLTPSDHKIQRITTGCSTSVQLESGATVFKEGLLKNTTLTKPGTDPSRQRLELLRPPIGFAMRRMQRLYRQIHSALTFTFVVTNRNSISDSQAALLSCKDHKVYNRPLHPIRIYGSQFASKCILT